MEKKCIHFPDLFNASKSCYYYLYNFPISCHQEHLDKYLPNLILSFPTNLEKKQHLFFLNIKLSRTQEALEPKELIRKSPRLKQEAGGIASESGHFSCNKENKDSNSKDIY